MWKAWQWFDPRQYVAVLFTFNFVLAIVIHFILLSTPRYNWLGDPAKGPGSAMAHTPASHQSALPPSR
ncbi:MAG: light-harvesting antenna LH1, alpha subunit [Myxococcota bacterium]